MSGMATVNRAFAKALARGNASSEGCTLTYERGEDGKQRQRLRCLVRRADGSLEQLTILIDGRADPVAAAEKLAADYVSTEQIQRTAPTQWDGAAKVRT